MLKLYISQKNDLHVKSQAKKKKDLTLGNVLEEKHFFIIILVFFSLVVHHNVSGLLSKEQGDVNHHTMLIF